MMDGVLGYACDVPHAVLLVLAPEKTSLR